ncbi:tetratricopeptide repeat protein [Flavobacterium sp.]|uniref:tetratricopeptide repeat protein n=1 Tax=Flavobacterium sp. TaxID=239 RepID=UPI0040335BFE
MLLIFGFLPIVALPAVKDKEYAALQAECTKFYDQGIGHYKGHNFIGAVEFLTKAESLNEKYDLNEKLLFDIKVFLGLSYFNLSDFGEAIGYYKEALTVGKKFPELAERCNSLTGDIGQIYYYEQDYKSAIEYFKKAYEIDIQKKYKSRPVRAITLALSYNMTGDPKTARRYLDEVRTMKKPEELQKLWQVTYAETYFFEGNVGEAERQMESLIKDLNKNWDQNYNSTIFYLNAVELLSNIYKKNGNAALAIHYANKGLEGGRQMVNKKAFYALLTDIYSDQKDYAAALKYKDSVIMAKDSMAAMVNRDLFETNKVKLRVQDYQSEIKYNEEKYDTERKLSYAVLAGLLGFVTIVILFLRQKKLVAERNRQAALLDLEREKADKLQLENEIRENEAKAQTEFQLLRDEIESRNRKLSAKALYLSGRNELIEDVINSLSATPGSPQDGEVSDYIRNLRSHLKSNHEWENFLIHFEEVNPGFINRLKEKHPELTLNDVRFIIYLYMNLSIKEIASMFNITPESCRKRKERIVAKMNIPDKIKIYSYISTI